MEFSPLITTGIAHRKFMIHSTGMKPSDDCYASNELGRSFWISWPQLMHLAKLWSVCWISLDFRKNDEANRSDVKFEELLWIDHLYACSNSTFDQDTRVDGHLWYQNIAEMNHTIPHLQRRTQTSPIIFFQRICWAARDSANQITSIICSSIRYEKEVS